MGVPKFILHSRLVLLNLAFVCYGAYGQRDHRALKRLESDLIDMQ